MNESTDQTGTSTSVNYELALTLEEARQGTQKYLPRNNKRLQVNIPPGVTTGSIVKLTNALETTDGHPGDILIQIRIKEGSPYTAGSMPVGVVEVSDDSFENEVLHSGLPVVVDFWAPWCGPCRMMAPVMEKAAEQYQGRFKFCKINVDENSNMASQYQAMSIPMLLFFRNGQVVDKIVGAVPESQLRAKLDSLA
jgi:thioredoxin 1